MAVYKDIMASLNELMDDAQGKPTGIVRHTVTIKTVPEYLPSDIRQIRLDAKFTQAAFASVLGVSKKSVEAWEGGRSKPDGAARRIISLIAQNPLFAEENHILVRENESITQNIRV